MNKGCSSKPVNPEDFTFTCKVKDIIPVPWKPFTEPIQYVALIQPDPNGPWELLSTNIPDFKFRTQKPFKL